MIGLEARPFAKTGGLADVLGALPSAVARLGWKVTLALLKYRGVDAGTLRERFPLAVGGYTREVGCFEVPLASGGRALLVDVSNLYDRDELYAIGNVDYVDNARRFAVLVRAVLEYAARRLPALSVVHAHEWQGGPSILEALYRAHPVLGGTPSVFRIPHSPIKGSSIPTGCHVSTFPGSSGRSMRSSSGAASAFSKEASTTPRSSRP